MVDVTVTTVENSDKVLEKSVQGSAIIESELVNHSKLRNAVQQPYINSHMLVQSQIMFSASI